MKIYIIIFLYYLFFCFGLFYQIKCSGFGYKIKDEKNYNKKSFKRSLVDSINLITAKIGHIAGGMYGFKSKKSYSEILDILSSERKVMNITFDSFIGYVYNAWVFYW